MAGSSAGWIYNEDYQIKTIDKSEFESFDLQALWQQQSSKDESEPNMTYSQPYLLNPTPEVLEIQSEDSS